MAFGGEMHHGIGLEFLEHLAHGRRIRDVRLDEAVFWIAVRRRDRGQIGGVGQLIDVEDLMVRLR